MAGVLDPPAGDLAAFATSLAGKYDGQGPADVLRAVAYDEFPGKVAVVSSFGAESAVLLNLVATVDPAIPVIFLDTLCHFPETLAYRDQLTAHLNLTDVRTIRPDTRGLAAEDMAGTLFRDDPDRCCHIRKTAPMLDALRGFSCWVSGRKRFQGVTRAALPLFEADEGWLKLNLLAHADQQALAHEFDAQGLPRHPLVQRGYPSIGCAPCTSPVSSEDADPRAGRWSGLAKTECGIHVVNGRMVRVQRV